jgi:hypothetical protein
LNAVFCFTLYQIASLGAVMASVFGTDHSSWWLMLHPISTIWYIIMVSALNSQR